MSKKIWLSFFYVFLAGACTGAPKVADSEQVLLDSPKVCVLDAPESNEHGRNIKAALTELLAEAPIDPPVQVFYLPIYSEEGALLQTKFLEQIASAKATCDLVHLSWNLPRSAATAKIEAELASLAEEKILVAAVGSPTDMRRVAPLQTTVMGQVPAALLVGESTQAGVTAYPSYLGPQILIFLQAPSNFLGSSFSSLRLTAKIASSWSKRSRAEWRSWSAQTRRTAVNAGPFSSLDQLLSF